MNEKELKYSKTHEWVAVKDGKAIVGISSYAAQELGDIVFIEVNETDNELNAGDVIGTIESVKAVSDLYTPVSGKIVNVNEDIINNPEIINQDPYEKGWIAEIELSDETEVKELFGYNDYEKFLESEKE